MIQVTKEILLPILDRCSKVANNKGAMVQLGHVHLELVDELLEYQATNLTTSIRGTCAATGSADRYTVNARDLQQAARSVVGDTVKLSRNEKGKLKVSGEGRRAFLCDTLPAEEFPVTPAGASTFIELPGPSVRQLIERVSFAMADPGDDREGLKSIRLRVQDSILSAAAANGRCLGFASDAVESTEQVTMVISRGGIGTILATEQDVLGFSATDRFIYIRAGQETIAVKTLADEGSFPPVEAALEQCWANRNKTASLSAPQLLESLQAIKRADSKAIADLTFLEGELKIESGREGEPGYAVDSVETQGGDTGEVRIDIDYLAGALRDSENVTVGFGVDLDAFTITDGMYKAIIMPMAKSR